MGIESLKLGGGEEYMGGGQGGEGWEFRGGG